MTENIIFYYNILYKECHIKKYLEKLFMKEISAENREKGTALANDICKNHRREGLYFDEILDQAVEEKQ